MRALLECGLSSPGDSNWDVRNLTRRIAGLPLLTRHLLGLRTAGITEVDLAACPVDAHLRDSLARLVPAGVSLRFVETGQAPEDPAETGIFRQRADTLIDPRLISQLARRLSSSGPKSMVCLDHWQSNYPAPAKSPYRVGAPGAEEAEPAGEPDKLHPIGLGISVNHNATTEALHVGRYYWHRIASARDADKATEKVFLATIKPTDGFYARTNRRVSIPISKLLARTAVTPNMVTLLGLACSLTGAAFYAGGTYWTMVAGSLVSWFASMLDGCDGEIARAKFRASEFGAWFEMVCDYVYYVVIFLGMGVGVSRYTGNVFWFWAGLGSSGGTILSFIVIARLKKRHARRAGAADFGRAFQTKVGEHSKNPIHGVTRHLGFFITRAAMPYFIVLFTVLDIAFLILAMILVGTNLAWSLTLAAYPLFRESKTGC